MTDPVVLYSQLTSHFKQRAWEEALSVAAKLLPLAPDQPDVYYIAGISNFHTQHLPQAIECLRKASALKPLRIDYATHFAKALAAANRNREARVVADYASSLPSSDDQILDMLGVIQSQIGSYESAASTFRRAVALIPKHAPYRYNLATSLVATGEISQAGIELEICLSLDPHHWSAHLALAQLQRQTVESNHLERLTALLAHLDQTGPSAHALTCVHLAISKEYEDLKRYPEAFEHMIKGKSAAAAACSYSTHRDEAIFSALTDCFSEPTNVEGGYASNEPIFVIGMPRSGTTLVERIISSHPDVDSAGELLNFAMSLKHFSYSPSPDLISAEVIRSAKEIDWTKLGELYLSSTRPSTGQKPRFIDKLPHNFLYAGFIAKALPNAKIVCLRRNPMDTCLSNFRQLFAPNSPFFDYSFDLLDTGRYYILFDRLMSHWRHVLRDRILEVNYEELVDSQESHSRRILDFCGLSWDERCLRFEENPSPVATASWVQVRSPIYRSSLKRWKKYEPQLHDLRALLIDGGIKLEE